MILENARLRVEITELGAELMSIYDKKNETELLFNGDPAFWKRRAPVLFPNVGKTYGNVMRINGKSFATSQHGFARDCIFTLEIYSANHAAYLLQSSNATREKYPFDFELRIRYTLEENSLKVLWSVKNCDRLPMPFTIGGHPAFCFARPTDSKADYMLEFPNAQTLEYILIDPAAAAANPDVKYSLPLNDHYLPLSETLFENDALIFDSFQINEVWLCDKNNCRRVGMKCDGFPNYGVWSVKNAPFVCLEPWMGRVDNIGFNAELSEKPNINIAAPGKTFEKEHIILLP